MPFRSLPHNLWVQTAAVSTATVVGRLAAECSHTAFRLPESHGAHREGFLDGTIITLRTNEASTWKRIPLMGTRWLYWCIFQQLRSSPDDYLNCFLITVLRIRTHHGSIVCSLDTEGNQFLHKDYISWLFISLTNDTYLLSFNTLDEEVDTTLMSVHWKCHLYNMARIRK